MIESILDVLLQQNIIADFFNELNSRLSNLDIGSFLKGSSVVLLAMLLGSVLVLVNDRLFESSIRRRVKTHHLTIRNDGNTDSLYLLHTVDLPNTLAVRFRIDGNPMIWVSVDSDKKNREDAHAAQEQAEEQKAAAEAAVVVDQDVTPASVIPNLANPMESVNAVTNAVSTVGRKAGFFASIISTISSLLPKSILPAPLKEAQDTLKSIQQDSSQVVGTINTKANAVSTLGDQLGKLPMTSKIGDMGKSTGKEAADAFKADLVKGYQPAQVGSDVSHSAAGDASNLNMSRDFVYDEEVWHRNIGQVDDKGGALNYAQSKVLKPGEAMKIDIEIMNLSESTAAISHLYKIEVVQVPQSTMRLSSVSRFLNGIVVFDKTTQWNRMYPTVIAFLLVIGAVQIIAGFTYLIF